MSTSSFSYSAPFRIYKILPNGKRARAEVSMYEFLNKGWQDNGWTPSTFTELKIADEMQGHKAFEKAVKGVPMQELRKFNDKVRIALPSEPTSRRTVTYGEWYTKYRPLGYKYQYESKVTPSYWERHVATRGELEAEVKKQDWWAPRRSYSQAFELRRWAFPEDDSTVSSDVIALQDWKNIPNPARRSGWSGRPNKGPLVVSRSRARKEGYPQRHDRSDAQLREDREDYETHWNRRKYPRVWDKWSYG